ncbi:hexosyltransferase [Elysia marginata]|uniref:Hexosyltransferase n=1 Tax=Elysia marginata TaxID=1093978 RepID=A0AAV4HMJ4_9GAST|nr:hexosyltransferase [Elysia marginata]
MSSELDLNWTKDMATTRSALQEEAQRYGDIMFLELQDVYRNLPLKQDTVPSYVMKTDDDCFINLPEIMRFLQELPKDVFMWWGNFRQYWAVERHGKWREESYSSSVYPRFACGSGSILSGPLSSWLAHNTHSLRMFQPVLQRSWIYGVHSNVYSCLFTWGSCVVLLNFMSALDGG